MIADAGHNPAGVAVTMEALTESFDFETIIGVVQEPVFGPLVVFGLGGIATEVLGDHAARLAPLTDTDADDLIHEIRAAPLLLGHRGQPAADTEALRGTLLRVSRLADDLYRDHAAIVPAQFHPPMLSHRVDSSGSVPPGGG